MILNEAIKRRIDEILKENKISLNQKSHNHNYQKAVCRSKYHTKRIF